MAFKLAEAFVSITSRDRSLRSSLSSTRRFITNQIFSIKGALLGLAGLAGGGALASTFINTAANAEEVQNKFEAVFKEMSGDAEEFAETFAMSIGRSIGETKRQMAEFQDTFVPLGFARDRAAELSKRMTELTADLASFNNIADSDAQANLTSGLVGNHEALRRFGVIITQATLDQELMNMGIAKGAKEATEQQKVMARLNIIIRSTSDAQGDAAATADSFTNRVKGLKGALRDMAGVIGSAVLPLLADMAGVATKFVRDFTDDMRLFVDDFRSWMQEVRQEWGLTMETFDIGAKLAVARITDEFRHLPERMAFWGGAAVRGFFKGMLDALLDVGKDISVDLNKVGNRAELVRFLLGQGPPPSFLFDMEASGNSFFEGMAGKKFEFEPSDEVKRLMKLLEERMKEVAAAEKEGNKDRKRDRPPQPPPQKKGAGFPSGFIGFADLARKYQEALLKRNPQERMVGLMEHDQVIQQRQLAAMERMANNEGGAGAAGRFPVARF